MRLNDAVDQRVDRGVNVRATAVLVVNAGLNDIRERDVVFGKVVKAGDCSVESCGNVRPCCTQETLSRLLGIGI